MRLPLLSCCLSLLLSHGLLSASCLADEAPAEEFSPLPSPSATAALSAIDPLISRDGTYRVCPPPPPYSLATGGPLFAQPSAVAVAWDCYVPRQMAYAPRPWRGPDPALHSPLASLSRKSAAPRRSRSSASTASAPKTEKPASTKTACCPCVTAACPCLTAVKNACTCTGSTAATPVQSAPVAATTAPTTPQNTIMPVPNAGRQTTVSADPAIPSNPSPQPQTLPTPTPSVAGS